MAQQRAKGSRTRVGLAASLLIHLTLIWAAILSLPRAGPPPEPPSFVVDLIPLQPLPTPRTRPRVQAPIPAAPAAPAAARAPTSQTPSAAPVPAPTPAASGEDEGRSAVRALLRGSVGCSEATFVHLTQDEQDRCAKWRRTHVDPNLELPAPIAPEKRAWFDAILAARARPDHPPGFVCGVLIDGIHLKIPKTPPHSLKFGPLPCYVVPPKWGVTEDADVGTPSKQDSAGDSLTYTPKSVFLTNGKANPGPPIDLGNSSGH
jgi:hypothetical protein